KSALRSCSSAVPAGLTPSSRTASPSGSSERDIFRLARHLQTVRHAPHTGDLQVEREVTDRDRVRQRPGDVRRYGDAAGHGDLPRGPPDPALDDLDLHGGPHGDPDVVDEEFTADGERLAVAAHLRPARGAALDRLAWDHDGTGHPFD